MLPSRVGREGVPFLGRTNRLDGKHFARQIAHRFLRQRLGFGPARPAQRVQGRPRPARADIFADQVRLAHGHVKFWRGLERIAGRVFDDQAFFARGRNLVSLATVFDPGRGQTAQAQIPPDAMLEVDHVIALRQFGKIDVQQ